MDPGKDREHLLALKGILFWLSYRFARYAFCLLNFDIVQNVDIVCWTCRVVEVFSRIVSEGLENETGCYKPC